MPKPTARRRFARPAPRLAPASRRPRLRPRPRPFSLACGGSRRSAGRSFGNHRRIRRQAVERICRGPPAPRGRTGRGGNDGHRGDDGHGGDDGRGGDDGHRGTRRDDRQRRDDGRGDREHERHDRHGNAISDDRRVRVLRRARRLVGEGQRSVGGRLGDADHHGPRAHDLAQRVLRRGAESGRKLGQAEAGGAGVQEDRRRQPGAAQVPAHGLVAALEHEVHGGERAGGAEPVHAEPGWAQERRHARSVEVQRLRAVARAGDQELRGRRRRPLRHQPPERADVRRALQLVRLRRRRHEAEFLREDGRGGRAGGEAGLPEREDLRHRKRARSSRGSSGSTPR